MKYISLFVLVFISFYTRAQVSGIVVNDRNQPLPSVSILIKNSYLGTSSNSNGEFSLQKVPKGRQTIIFKSLGYKTQQQTIDVQDSLILLRPVLEEDKQVLEEIVITNTENPALRIISEAIRHREANGNKVDKYEADFYSKGIMRMERMPKKTAKKAAQELPGLDSTGAGIIYLSETVSKISFQKPNKLYEEVVASKLSGNDQGFSFNTAIGANFDFYSNIVPLGKGIVSPIAYNAFSYYNYTLVDVHEEDGQQIYQIKVTPKRDKEPTVDGLIFIVDNTWEIYAVDFSVPGYRTQQPVVDSVSILQHYAWHETDKRWTKSMQNISLSLSLFGFKANGSYLQNFSNYTFVEAFPKGTFGKTLTRVNEGANIMDSLYWKLVRPVELTNEERRDYVFKDSIQNIRTSKTYLDSVDRESNKFKPLDPLMGYIYQNSYRQYKIAYAGLSNALKSTFNAVQGFTFTAALTATLGKNETGPLTRFENDFQYAFSERKLRFHADYQHRFNTKNYAQLNLKFGSEAVPFNEGQGVSPLINSISSLFFKDNYIQLYQREQVKLEYAQNIGTPVRLFFSAGWARRSPLFNNTDYAFLRSDKRYVSNNPLLPENDNTPAFSSNDQVALSADLRWTLGQRSIERPDATFYLTEKQYPVVSIGFKQAFNLTDEDMSYQHLYGSIGKTTSFGTFGTLTAKVNGGTFFHAENIPLMDFKHFAGNQTHVGDGMVNDANFMLLPYYSRSTNGAYFQLHAEQDFKGLLFNKIPLIQQLQWGLVAGYHQLASVEQRPYHEFTVGIDNIGWGKLRIFRVDYIRTLEGSRQSEGIVVGIKLLNALNAFR